MDNRRRRFFSAVSICQAKAKEDLSDSERQALAGWIFSLADHPLTGNKMAIGEKPMVLHGEHDIRNQHVRYDATFYLTATRLDSSTEVSAGFGIAILGADHDMRHSLLDDQAKSITGLIHCFETAQATKDTAQIKVGWRVDAGTSKPDVAVFRGIPRVIHISETVVFFEKQMTAKWARSEPDNPVDESALSGRNAMFAPGDRIAFGIPWIHRDHSIVADVNISRLPAAVEKVKALVAP